MTASSVRNDLTIYDRDGAGWWDPADRAFASLRRVNRFRLELLDSWLGDRGTLAGIQVVDLGCGGGLLSVPLAERGADVVGVDLSSVSLTAARRRAPRGARFVRGDLCATPLADSSVDVALLADVLEHVDEPLAAVREAARLLRPGGHLFVSTINRTWRARLLAVSLAESLGLIPRGTHDPARFVRPDELARFGRTTGLEPVAWQGESVDVWSTIRARAISLRRGRSVAVGYCCWLRKGGQQ